MLNFEFCCPVKLVFGKDTQGLIGQELKPYAKKVLLHYGAGSIKKSGLYDTVVKSLKENDIEIVEEYFNRHFAEDENAIVFEESSVGGFSLWQARTAPLNGS